MLTSSASRTCWINGVLKVAALLQLQLVLVVCFWISGHQQHLSSFFCLVSFPALVVSVYLSNVCSFYLLPIIVNMMDNMIYNQQPCQLIQAYHILHSLLHFMFTNRVSACFPFESALKVGKKFGKILIICNFFLPSLWRGLLFLVKMFSGPPTCLCDVLQTLHCLSFGITVGA